MCISKSRIYSVTFAVLLGIAVAAILYFVPGATISALLWIGTVLAGILLVTVLIISGERSGGMGSPIGRYLQDEGKFLFFCLVGTLVTGAITLTLFAPLSDDTSAALILLVFFFGFFFGGMLASVYCMLSTVYTCGRAQQQQQPICYR